MTNGTVTLRERDTCEQIRLPATELLAYINERLDE